MRIRFWGTRGSLARPGPSTLRYGGNTACVEARAADGTLIVLDCGTGIYSLGQTLLAAGPGPIQGHLLITHTHWDHIQGFPFFTPLFVPGNQWTLYAPGGLGQRLESTLAGQMEYTYFPVTLGQLGAQVEFRDLGEGTFAIGGIRVTAHYLNHPALTLGYRLEVGGAVVVYSTDHEPHAQRSGRPGGPDPMLGLHREDARHIEFLQNADLVIHDAQYTLEEYAKKVGWGHTPAEWAVDYALAAGAKRLAIFHHDPARHDEALDDLIAVCRQRAADAGSGLDVFGAAEGQLVELPERADWVDPPGQPVAPSVAPTARAPHRTTVLIADDDPDIVRLIVRTLEPEGFRLLVAADGETALALARAERPTLLLLDLNMPGLTGLEVCRALRADADPALRQAPVVLITAQMGPANLAAGFEAGVTDYLTKPFTPSHVRSRSRAWVLRAGAGTNGG